MYLFSLPKLNRYLEKAFEDSQNGEITYIPFGIGKHNRSILLAPPGNRKESLTFISGLLVPDMRIKRIINSPRGSSCILHSKYTGEYFYMPMFREMKELVKKFPEESLEFQGIIRETNEHNDKHPNIHITMNSTEDPEIFELNREELKRALDDSKNFWWEYSMWDNIVKDVKKINP